MWALGVKGACLGLRRWLAWVLGDWGRGWRDVQSGVRSRRTEVLILEVSGHWVAVGGEILLWWLEVRGLEAAEAW